LVNETGDLSLHGTHIRLTTPAVAKAWIDGWVVTLSVCVFVSRSVLWEENCLGYQHQSRYALTLRSKGQRLGETATNVYMSPRLLTFSRYTDRDCNYLYPAQPYTSQSVFKSLLNCSSEMSCVMCVCVCVRLSLDAPVVTCPATSARVGERSIRLRCEIRAQPDLSALFWITDVNGTTVAEGATIDDFWSASVVSSCPSVHP